MASATLNETPTFSPQLRPDRAVIRVAGEGALSFLNNLLTADLSNGRPAYYGALLSPQGKILHDLFIVPQDDVFWLDVASVQAADLLKRLNMYRLRAKLDIAISPDHQVAVSMQPNLPGLAFADPRFDAIGFRAIVPAGALATGTGYDEARIFHGLADSVQDIGTGELFVHEANMDQLNGVSFSKGCYVGQEVVSRTHHRHTARNRILPVRLDGEIAHGTELLAGDLRLGTMLSSALGFGLALLRLDRLAEAPHPLMFNGVTMTVHKPEWAQFEVPN